MVAMKKEIEEQTLKEINVKVLKDKDNSTALLNATSKVREAETQEKKAKEQVRQAISSGDEEERKKAEALLAAANAAARLAAMNAKKTVNALGDQKDKTAVVDAEVNNLQNELNQEESTSNSGKSNGDNNDSNNKGSNEDNNGDSGSSGSSDSAMDSERGAEFNELDVVPASDEDVCAVAECIPASEGVQPSATFTKSIDVNFQIIEQSRIQSLQIWNDALSEQIQECFKKNQTFQNLIDSKIQKEQSFTSLEMAQKNKAAATLTKENSQAALNNLLQLVTYYDQKRALSRQQMTVCNQCPKMKIYQDATAEADVSFTKYKAQYTLAEMQKQNADLGVTNATLKSQEAELQATRGVDSVTTLTQDLTAAEKTCDDKFPEEEEAKNKYNLKNQQLEKFNANKIKLIQKEMNRLLKTKRSQSYYFSTRAGSHIKMAPSLYDAVAATSTGALTVSLWVKLNSLGHDSTLISARGENGGQVYGWAVGVNSMDGFYFDATVEGKTTGSVERRRMKSKGDIVELAMHVWYNIGKLSFFSPCGCCVSLFIYGGSFIFCRTHLVVSVFSKTRWCTRAHFWRIAFLPLFYQHLQL